MAFHDAKANERQEGEWQEGEWQEREWQEREVGSSSLYYGQLDNEQRHSSGWTLVRLSQSCNVLAKYQLHIGPIELLEFHQFKHSN